MNLAELQAIEQTGDYDLMAPVEWSSAERELPADELSSIQGISDSKACRIFKYNCSLGKREGCIDVESTSVGLPTPTTGCSDRS